MNELATITVDWENNADGWWEAVLRVVFPDELLPIIDDEQQSVTVSAARAREILDWCATLPGWDGGPDHARHPLLFQF